ncbi:MAG: EAL domain-containing protein [Lachnospiraceae bacterium]|nr:EAL domain-containing protein [Lachnospiraceae bacterium]
MFRALVLLLIVLIISMIVCVSIVNKKLIKNRSHVVHLINMAIFTAACYTVFILVPFGYDTLATFMSGLYFLSTDWLVIYLMFFVAAYTHIQPPSKLPRRIIGILAGVDSISFLINTFTHHMFKLEAGSSDQTGISYWNIQLQPPHTVHRILVYSIVLYSLCILIYRLIKSPVMFKNKYSSILFQTLAVVGLNVFCSVKNAKFDYSVILYASLAISICYFALYALPKKVLEKICSTIVEDSVIGMFAYDNDGKCVGVNEMAKDLFAGDEEIEVIAERYLADWFKEHKDSSLNVIGEERTVIKNGEKKYIYVTYQKYLDEKGRRLGCCFQFEDRTEVVMNFKEEKYRATHDMLTGLLNREAFEIEVKKILAKAEEPYCMVCSNIQDFKMINELYGSDAGDKLLMTQADMIRSKEEEGSVSARIYADKFCTLMPRRSFNEKMFTENMSKLLDLGEESPFKPHFYLGVYDITDVSEPVWTMYDKAILAINTIRGNYGKYIAYYKEELLERILEEREVLGGFDRALAEGQFHMFLQPQIANNGTIVGAEALVRWIHPEKGLVNPGVFIPTLEKAGLIHKLDLYMWECAAKKLEEWKTQGKEDLSISVNISTKDFFYLDIPKTFSKLAQKYDFDIDKLKLEITESALIENVLAIMKTLDELHTLGYDIEIDDFGSGYSSLGMLKDINADILKIDMIFLQETKNIMRSNTILKNVISMSKELGMPIIMEGVETKEQVDFLMNAGCDMFQGYYFAKPMNVENFEQAYC